ncbi:MAG TPA: DUF2339 domain-containing protein, partial [Vicinamibacterales bacterium]|nr:DUF2339 domain-containing protein [Vicinamibacterales bacterium]
MELLVLVAIVVLAVPFVLPIASWVSAQRTRARVASLQGALEEQRAELELVKLLLERVRAASPAVGPAPAEKPAREPEPVAAPAPAAEPIPTPSLETPAEREPVAPAIEVPVPPAEVPPEAAIQGPPAEEPGLPGVAAAGAAADHDVPAGAPVRPPRPVIDWESLVGVKLFSAIAGIALVFAAVFFLRYSIEHGWLQPPVRVAIGVIVGVGLLVTCELKAARRYPFTANALDAAAIAILFSTFFAAHALWDLVPASATFGLLVLVTVLAVLLSIRRESLFIAVLGLMGGFAAPALLSTGENRPIPLFSYLLLLNIGLAWVAFRKGWPILSWLTLILTTLYQWGWVFRFLDASALPLAMSVFLIFPLTAIVGLLAARRVATLRSAGAGGSLERTALTSAVLPALFAVYLAAVPEYGVSASLMFGFLLVLDSGLLAVALTLRDERLHAAGALATILTVAVWLSTSYASHARLPAVAFVAAFAAFFLFAPAIASRVGRPLAGVARSTSFTAPLLLFAFPVLAAIEPAFADPTVLFGTLLALVLLIGWRAIRGGPGALYYVAGFFAVAAQAVWSASHLDVDRLGTAVGIYTAFGLVALAVPVAARRSGRPLGPSWASGVVLLASLALLLFLAAGQVAPAALWAMALLLAILNAALFVESAAGRLPWIAQAGSVLSWFVLAVWWTRAGASVGVLPSLIVLTGLTLATFAGHAWSVSVQRVSSVETA